MSAPAHDDAHGHGHPEDQAGVHFTRKDYVTGFLLAAGLTIVPFWLVMGAGIGGPVAAFLVMGLAAIQVVVHMVYFLHMNPRSEGGWTMLALLFTVLIVGIVLSGSLWVMQHLHANMTPPSPQEMRLAP